MQRPTRSFGQQLKATTIREGYLGLFNIFKGAAVTVGAPLMTRAVALHCQAMPVLCSPKPTPPTQPVINDFTIKLPRLPVNSRQSTLVPD